MVHVERLSCSGHRKRKCRLSFRRHFLLEYPTTFSSVKRSAPSDRRWGGWTVAVRDIDDSFPASIGLFLPERGILAALYDGVTLRIAHRHLIRANAIAKIA